MLHQCTVQQPTMQNESVVIEADAGRIEQEVCPVCARTFETCQDKRRAMKQHIDRMHDPAHRLWKGLYWKIHFTKGGYQYMPRQRDLCELQHTLEQVFGEQIVRQLINNASSSAEVQVQG